MTRQQNKWTREELILTLSVYFQLPFGRLNRTTPEVKDLARLLGRTDNSAALRLVNFASCDPILQERGIKGMTGGKARCKPIWNEFYEHRETLIFESERILAQYQHTSIESKFHDDLLDIPENLTGDYKLQEDTGKSEHF